MNQELTNLIQNIAFSYFWAHTILLVIGYLYSFTDSYERKRKLQDISDTKKAHEGNFIFKVNFSFKAVIVVTLYILSIIYM